MKEFPDVVGLELEEAQHRLKTESETPNIRICYTKADRHEVEAGSCRVINQKCLEGTWVLTACRIPDDYR